MGWDDNGLATERRVQNYFGVRCDPSLAYSRPRAARGRRPGQGAGAGGGVAPELRRAVRTAGRRGRAGVRGGVAPPGPVGRLDPVLHDHRRGGPRGRRSAASSACSPRARRTRPRPRPSGTWTSRPRSPRPSSRTASGRGPTTAWSSGVPATSDVLIDTTRPELLPACVAVVAHPDDGRFARTGRGARCAPRCSASRSPSWPIPWPNRTRGRGRPWSAPSATSPTSCGGASSGCRCGRWSGATAGCSTARPPGSRTGPADVYERELAGRTVRQAQTRIVELLGEAGGTVGRAPAGPARGQVLREGRPAARDRDQPPVVLPDPRSPAGPAGPGAPAALAPALHAGPVRRAGWRDSTPTG